MSEIMEYSILLTVYKLDNPQYFKTSLESILNQTMPSNDIVIVIDGPATEEIYSIIDEYKQRNKAIHPLQLEKNVGLGNALNEGLKVCVNDLVARMDSDDISLPDRFEKQLDMFLKNPELDIVGSPVVEFVGDVNNVVGYREVPINHKSIIEFSKRRDPFNHPTVMFRKSKVLKYGPYADYRKNQDTDLWIKLLSNGCKAENFPTHLLFFRFDENTYKKRKSWINTKTLINIRRNAWKNGYCSFLDFFIVMSAQLSIFVLPNFFQRILYTKILRRKNESRKKN